MWYNCESRKPSAYLAHSQPTKISEVHMTVWRLAAIVFILFCVTVAWMILGSSIIARTQSGYVSLGEQVEELWGAPHTQNAPSVKFIDSSGREQSVELHSSDIDVDLSLDPRRKGLLWYATYNVDFNARYSIKNPLDEAVTTTVSFEFPSYGAVYDGFLFSIKGVQATPKGDMERGPTNTVVLSPGEEAEIRLAYRSRGLDTWRYSFGGGVTTVSNFELTVNTNFQDIDFPDHSVSASQKTPTGQGWRLLWTFTSLVSDFDVGVRMPKKINPGDVASRMSYFAPVSLLFFFTVLVVLGVIGGTNLHPMHYFFLGASFFSFHLLFAYLVDHIALELAFVIAAIVSMLLVISYLWRVAGRRFALREAGISQFLFLVLFSYAFFFEGYTGLVVTIGAIITLAILMQVSAKVDWAEVFRREKRDRPTAGTRGLR